MIVHVVYQDIWYIHVYIAGQEHKGTTHINVHNDVFLYIADWHSLSLSCRTCPNGEREGTQSQEAGVRPLWPE